MSRGVAKPLESQHLAASLKMVWRGWKTRAPSGGDRGPHGPATERGGRENGGDIDPCVRTELDLAVAACKGGWRRRPSDDEVIVAVNKGVSDVGACCVKCESPIERLIVPRLIFHDYGLTPECSPVSLATNDASATGTYCIEPQVSLGGARFDFIMAAPHWAARRDFGCRVRWHDRLRCSDPACPRKWRDGGDTLPPLPPKSSG